MDMCSGPKVAAARRPARRYLSPTCETRSELFGHSPRPFRAFGLARNLSGSLTDVMRDVRVHELLDAHDRCRDEEAESDEQEKGLLERESTARGARRRRRDIIARARRATVSEVQGYRRRVARGGRCVCGSRCGQLLEPAPLLVVASHRKARVTRRPGSTTLKNRPPRRETLRCAQRTLDAP